MFEEISYTHSVSDNRLFKIFTYFRYLFVVIIRIIRRKQTQLTEWEEKVLLLGSAIFI